MLSAFHKSIANSPGIFYKANFIWGRTLILLGFRFTNNIVADEDTQPKMVKLWVVFENLVILMEIISCITIVSDHQMLEYHLVGS